MIKAELMRNSHFLRERFADAERKQDLAETAIAELRGKLALAHAESALVRAWALPAGRTPAGIPAPAKTPARKKPDSEAAVGAHEGPAREPAGASRV